MRFVCAKYSTLVYIQSSLSIHWTPFKKRFADKYKIDINYLCMQTGKKFYAKFATCFFLEYFIKHPIMNIIIIDIMSIDHRLYVTLGSLHSINSSMINWTKIFHKFWFSQGLSKYKCRWWGISRCEDTKRHWVQWLIY